jgi:hypothetical protein
MRYPELPRFNRHFHSLARKTALAFFSFGFIARIAAPSGAASAVQLSAADLFLAGMHFAGDWETALTPGSGWGGVNDIRFPLDRIHVTAHPVPHPNITTNTQSPSNLCGNDLNMVPAHMNVGPAHLTAGGWHGPTS